MTPLLQAVDVQKSFDVAAGVFSGGKTLRAVDGVSIELMPGETLGIAGESGCGKSTLARLLVGLIKPTQGEILYEGKPLSGMGKRGLSTFRKDVQMIFQDPFSSLNPRMRVGEIIGEPLAIHGIAGGAVRRELVVRLMDKVGLAAGHFYRYPHEFSGGQRQRIGIARALAVNPRVIVADEPVSALDLSIQAQILNLLRDLRQELKLSTIFIAHDLSVVRYMSDKIAIMYLGKVVEVAPSEMLFSRYMHPYTEALFSAIPRVGASPAKRVVLKGDLPSPLMPPSGCPFHTRCPYVSPPLCTEHAPPLEEKEVGHLAACHFSKKLFY